MNLSPSFKTVKVTVILGQKLTRITRLPVTISTSTVSGFGQSTPLHVGGQNRGRFGSLAFAIKMGISGEGAPGY